MISISLLITFLLSLVLILISKRFNLYDIPDDRKLHLNPTSKLGGLAIVLSYFLSTYKFSDINIQLLLSCSILITLITADDILELNRYFRLAVQIIASFPILYCILSTTSSALTIILSILLICGFINLFNFFDGLNTLLTSQFILIISYFIINQDLLFLKPFEDEMYILLGSSIGFLILNSFGLIFMGDIGSCFMGVITSLLFLNSITIIDLNNIAILISPLMPVLSDTIYTIIIRFKNGEKFFSTPHKQHAYQLLNLLGLNHFKVSIIYILKFIIYTFSIYSCYRLEINNDVTSGIFLLILFADTIFMSLIRKSAFKKGLV